ncbi:class I SAM-dependent methyltransferase [Sandarakinorhabdus sp. DWP1-3-1]|uniref:class I SAM-dependent methyltransferase n=1 Tax=Sandarakinorhabdus sp. DWP1-3-1 TaxID=2804627 RepID=UPI003CE87EBB
MTDAAALTAVNRTFHTIQQPMRLLPNYYGWTYGHFARWLHGTVVELGCGAGWGLPFVVDHATRIIAVDHDPALLQGIRERRLPKVETLQADLMSTDWPELGATRADAILMMDVLEHFADDRAFLATAAGFLNPGGHLLIKVPADSSRYCAMDKASGHYRRYDASHLADLAAATGLELVHSASINRLGGLAYRMRKRRETNFSRSFPPWQLRMINLGLGVVRLADYLPLPDGLSLMAVMRKPAI